MLSLLILDNNEKVNNWISAKVSPEKIKPFDTNLELAKANLATERVISKFNNSVLMQKYLKKYCCIVTSF